MATAVAQTALPDLSSFYAPSASGVVADAGTCGAARPAPCRTRPTMDAPAACSDADDGISADVPAAACSDPDGEQARLEPLVVGPDGAPYPGVLLDDILEYRALRAHMLAGNRIDPDAHARYLELELRLRAREEPGTERGHLRAFHRFDVQITAGVRFWIGSERVLGLAAVENISAGGVKLMVPEAPAVGDAVWLQLRLPGGALAILPSRVIWARGNAVGLMFAGAPRWS